MNGQEKIKVWTAQSKIVIDTIENTGTYHVKRDYILQKYQEISKLFLEPYDWFVRNASQMVARPQGAEYAVWVFLNRNMVSNAGPGDYLIEAHIPKDEVIVFDEAKWLRILNLAYIPGDPDDGKKFKDKLNRYGLTQDSQAYLSNFYPQLKQEIVKSWDRLFDESIKLPGNQMGAVWELKKEWIEKITAP